MVAATVSLVVSLVVVSEALDHELLAVPISTDLVLVCSFVVRNDLVYLGYDFATVVLIVLEVRLLLLHALVARASHNVIHVRLLIDLHYLGLLLHGGVGG